MNSQIKKIALWIKKNKAGDNYFSIRLSDGSWINLFRNVDKLKGDKKPDFVQAIEEKNKPVNLEYNNR